VDLSGLPTAEALRQFQAAHQARMAQLKERAADVRARLAATEITASSRDGAVTVVVGAGGVLKELRFGPKAGELPLGKLSTTVLQAYRQACAEAAARSTQAMSALVGPDNPSYQMLRDAVPPVPAEEDTE
jgi:DNA-binding protein YbaB